MGRIAASGMIVESQFSRSAIEVGAVAVFLDVAKVSCDQQVIDTVPVNVSCFQITLHHGVGYSLVGGTVFGCQFPCQITDLWLKGNVPDLVQGFTIQDTDIRSISVWYMNSQFIRAVSVEVTSSDLEK